jgi:hypothetical protein
VALSYCIPLRLVALLYSSLTHSWLGQAWDSETLAHNCILSHSSPSHVIASLRLGVEDRFLSRARLGISLSIQAMLLESAKNFFYVLPVRDKVVGEDQDVIQIDNDIIIEEILKNVIHETLKSGQGIGKSERHY